MSLCATNFSSQRIIFNQYRTVSSNILLCSANRCTIIKLLAIQVVVLVHLISWVRVEGLTLVHSQEHRFQIILVGWDEPGSIILDI